MCAAQKNLSIWQTSTLSDLDITMFIGSKTLFKAVSQYLIRLYYPSQFTCHLRVKSLSQNTCRYEISMRIL